MKKLYTLVLLCIPLFSCIAPFDGLESGMGQLNIILPGGTGDGKVAVTENEKTGMRYEITFTGPGGTITRTLENGENKISEKVLPGTWTIKVLAYAVVRDPALSSVIGDGQLRGMVTRSVNVKNGETAPVSITLGTVTGVETWAQLDAAITHAEDGDLIILQADIEYGGTLHVPANTTVTLLADENREISCGTSSHSYFFDLASPYATLILGETSSSLPGKLTLRGSPSPSNSSLIRINDSDATLVMNDNVFLVDNQSASYAGAVSIIDGTFEMNGGTISDNSGQSGGGVFVGAGALFTLNGGTVNGNNTGTQGKNVLVWDVSTYCGRFFWTGGTIPNIADSIQRYDGGSVSFDFKGWNLAGDWSGNYYPVGPTPHTDLSPVWSGDGFIPQRPKAITTAAELAALTTGPITPGTTPEYFAMATNITVNTQWTPLGDGANPFEGTLNGNYHTITFNAGMTATADNYAGLFGLMESGAAVKCVTIAGALSLSNTSPNLYVGGIAGKADAGAITHCSVKSAMTITKTTGTAYVGGIVGLFDSSSPSEYISLCSYTGANIRVNGTGDATVGGITGGLQGSDGAIENCYSTGNITYSGSGSISSIGGIAGKFLTSSTQRIEKCYATGIMTGVANSAIGGILGDNLLAASTSIFGCVALNTRIHNGTTFGADVGRVVGVNTASFPLGNFGRDNMTGPVLPWSPISPTNKNGDDVSLAATQAAGGYWWFTDPAGPQWLTTEWDWDSSTNRPKLWWE
jgi:hypothetical protein